jgi:Ca-activated chloride channel family protein
MPSVELREPLLLLVALAAIPVYYIARGTAGRVLFSSLRLLPADARSPRARLLAVPPLLLALATASLGVALAGPRVPDQTTRVQRKGIAIAVAVDISGSMRALDLSEEGHERTRLDAVKEVLTDFVQGRPDDAIGLVSFARFADCRCPLTLDHQNLLLIAQDLDNAAPEDDGTALGDGLGLALERLRESPAESKVCILLTDGCSNTGEIAPLQAAQVARALGIRVYTVGAGTEGYAPIRVEDPFTGRKVLRQIAADLDEKTLGAIAQESGGRYFRASDAEGLRSCYREIDRLERTQVAEVRYLQYHELFYALVALSLLLASTSFVLEATWLRRLP